MRKLQAMTLHHALLVALGQLISSWYYNDSDFQGGQILGLLQPPSPRGSYADGNMFLPLFMMSSLPLSTLVYYTSRLSSICAAIQVVEFPDHFGSVSSH